MLGGLLLVASAALAACPGEPVTLGRGTLYYTVDSSCGNGRDAACLSEHVLSRPPDCGRDIVFEEHYGGGTSTRRGYYPSTMSQQLQRLIFAKVADGHYRGDGAADLLAHDPPELSAPVDGRRTATATRWVDGPPRPPRNSWTGRGCEPHEQVPDAEGASCSRIFRGDQVTAQRVDPLGPSASLHLYANSWRNREVFYVVHDHSRDRHTYVGLTVTTSPDELPIVLTEHQGGLVLVHATREGGLLLHRVHPDGRLVQRSLEPGTPSPTSSAELDTLLGP